MFEQRTTHPFIQACPMIPFRCDARVLTRSAFTVSFLSYAPEVKFRVGRLPRAWATSTSPAVPFSRQNAVLLLDWRIFVYSLTASAKSPGWAPLRNRDLCESMTIALSPFEPVTPPRPPRPAWRQGLPFASVPAMVAAAIFISPHG